MPPRAPYNSTVSNVRPTKLDDPNSASGIIALSPSLFSASTNINRSRQPAAKAASATADQPREELSVSAHVASPRPAVASVAPSQSRKFWSRRWSAGTHTQANAMAAAAIGILMRKMRRQLPISISQPPSTGPKAPAAAPVAAQIPMARPFASPEKVCPRIARLFGISIAALAPWTKRATSSHPIVGADAQPSEASANKPVPKMSSRRRPYRSPAAPPSSRSALSGNR